MGAKFASRVLVLLLLVAFAGDRAAAQMYTTEFLTLYSFTNGVDGANPDAGLVLSSNTLFGTTYGAGAAGYGTVFGLNTNGGDFATLHVFTNGIDGAHPYAGLILVGNMLYGTATSGGTAGYGTVFAVNTDGTGFTNLYAFTNGIDGSAPYAGLMFSSNLLYGTASSGGAYGAGTVFALGTNGTGFTNLHSFNGDDGASPRGTLSMSGGMLFGTTSSEGPGGGGSMFRMNADGTDFVAFYDGGGSAEAGVTFLGSAYYLASQFGGDYGDGGVLTGSSTNLASFPHYSFSGPDGSAPYAELTATYDWLWTLLYGTTSSGGAYSNGTAFVINPNPGIGGRPPPTAALTPLHNFTGGADGAKPMASLVLSNNTLFGTTYAGGTAGYGTVFSISVGPWIPLHSQFTNENIVLTWDYTDFSLQSAPSAGGPWTTAALNTNFYAAAMTNAAQFFRLYSVRYFVGP